MEPRPWWGLVPWLQRVQASQDAAPVTDAPAPTVVEPESRPPAAGEGQLPAGTPPARMPVPPLLADLAGWGWRLLLLGVIAVLLLWVAQQLYLVSLPVAAALLLTALLSPAVAALRRHGWPRPLATAATVLGMLVAVGGLLTWVVQRAIAEVPTLSAELQRALRQLPISNATLLRVRGQFVAYLQSGSGSVAGGVLTGVQTAAEVLTGILLTLLLTAILLADGDEMWRWLVTRLPASARIRAMRAGAPAWTRLSGWVRGTVIIAAVHAVVLAVTLLLLGVPLVAPLAVLIFLGSFIPLVGAVVSGAAAVLTTFAARGLTAAIVVVVVLVIDSQVEAHALQPFLVGRYVRLHPFVVAVVITTGALVGGLAGALLAVPFTAAAYAALTNLADPRPRRTRTPRARRMRRRRPPPATD
jgi:predicted PurR-regulated permease PerM